MKKINLILPLMAILLCPTLTFCMKEEKEVISGISFKPDIKNIMGWKTGYLKPVTQKHLNDLKKLSINELSELLLQLKQTQHDLSKIKVDLTQSMTANKTLLEYAHISSWIKAVEKILDAKKREPQKETVKKE